MQILRFLLMVLIFPALRDLWAKILQLELKAKIKRLEMNRKNWFLSSLLMSAINVFASTLAAQLKLNSACKPRLPTRKNSIFLPKLNTKIIFLNSNRTARVY